MIFTIVKVLAVIAAFAASSVSIGLFMGATGEDNLDLFASIAVLYFVCGSVIGVCFPQRWYLAVAVAWWAIMLAPEFIIGFFRGGTPPEAVVFVLSPVAALVGGLLGSHARRFFLAATRDR